MFWALIATYESLKHERNGWRLGSLTHWAPPRQYTHHKHYPRCTPRRRFIPSYVQNAIATPGMTLRYSGTIPAYRPRTPCARTTPRITSMYRPDCTSHRPCCPTSCMRRRTRSSGKVAVDETRPATPPHASDVSGCGEYVRQAVCQIMQVTACTVHIALLCYYAHVPRVVAPPPPQSFAASRRCSS